MAAEGWVGDASFAYSRRSAQWLLSRAGKGAERSLRTAISRERARSPVPVNGIGIGAGLGQREALGKKLMVLKPVDKNSGCTS